jgi:riboflavin transporter FmnP
MSVATLITSVTAAFLNYFLLIPFFANLFIAAPISTQEKIDIIIGAFTSIFPFIDSLLKAVCFSIVPFNIIKYAVISIITFVVYKKISSIFKKQ